MAGILAGHLDLRAPRRRRVVLRRLPGAARPHRRAAARDRRAGEARRRDPSRPFVLVCAHAGLKTGEDGPTHADPQPLQLLQENFPRGTVVTLTPWDPAEIWPLLGAALRRRPALIAPFVTRPNETVLDRAAAGLAPVAAAASGVYLLRAPRGKGDVTIVLQESAVTYAFVEQALPLLEREGIDVRAYYVASAELFDALPPQEQQRLFPEAHAQEAMGITGFTLPTMYRWIRSDLGRAHTLHPFAKGHFLGSGAGAHGARGGGPRRREPGRGDPPLPGPDPAGPRGRARHTAD